MEIKERRRFPRYDCSLKVDYSTLGIAALESRSVVKNISEGGIRVPISRIIRRGDVLSLRIYHKNDEPPIPAAGRVKWMDDNRDSRLIIDAGIEFTDIKSFDADALLATVKG